MNAAGLSAFRSQAATVRTALRYVTIKVAGTNRSAYFTAPRLSPQLDDSTVRVDRYRSTLRIFKSEVTAIATPAAWVGVKIELPEGAGWRTYLAIPELVQDIDPTSEWRLEVESI